MWAFWPLRVSLNLGGAIGDALEVPAPYTPLSESRPRRWSAFLVRWGWKPGHSTLGLGRRWTEELFVLGWAEGGGGRRDELLTHHLEK